MRSQGHSKRLEDMNLERSAEDGVNNIYRCTVLLCLQIFHAFLQNIGAAKLQDGEMNMDLGFPWQIENDIREFLVIY